MATTATTSTPRRVVSESELEANGFTAEQIERLQTVRSRYPWLEFTDTPEEWHRLEFLRWRVATGRVRE